MDHAARPASIWPTTATTLLAVALFSWCLYLITDRLTAWTFEVRRANAVARGELRAGPIDLIDAKGQTQRIFASTAEDASPNDIWLVDFIYTRCPSFCQALGSEYYRMQQQLLGTRHGSPSAAGQGRVRLLSISLDPEHDTPTALAAHGALHRADARVWTLASPRNATEGRELMQRLGVISIPDGAGGFVHNAGIHMISHDGRLLRVAEFGAWEDVLQQAQALVEANACKSP